MYVIVSQIGVVSMFSKEKREEKRVRRVEEDQALREELIARRGEVIRALQDELLNCQKEKNKEDFFQRLREAEVLYKEFRVNTFGQKRALDRVLQLANDSEVLKCVMPGNYRINEKATGKKIASDPGAWFVSDERVLLCYHEPLNKTHVYEYPVETLESVSARGNGLTAGKVQIATKDEVIIFTVSYKESTYRNIERVFNELIHGAFEVIQKKSQETDNLTITVCASCKATKIFTKGTLSTCDYCRSPIRVETVPTSVIQPVFSGLSAADEIIKLKNLMETGIITQEEFDHKKKRLLGM